MYYLIKRSLGRYEYKHGCIDCKLIIPLEMDHECEKCGGYVCGYCVIVGNMKTFCKGCVNEY